MAGSALLAMIPGLGIMWMVNVVIDVMFVAYVALLVRMRNVAAEREMKLTFLPTARADPGSLPIARRSRPVSPTWPAGPPTNVLPPPFAAAEGAMA